MGAVKKQFMATTMDDMGGSPSHYSISEKGIFSNHAALGFTSEEAMLEHTPWNMGSYLSQIKESDMDGDYNVLPEIGKSIPLTKSEAAFKRKFEYRVKTVVKYLGRSLLWTEFTDIHETLTKDLEIANGQSNSVDGLL